MTLAALVFTPDPSKAVLDLQEFAEANENRLYRLLRSAMDPQTDLKTLVKINVSRADGDFQT